MIDAAIASIGQPQAAHVDYARAMMAELPDDLRAGLRSVDGAKGILVALIAREAVQGTDLRAPLQASGEMNALDHASWFSAAIAALPDAQRLPLAQLAFPALRALPAAERNRFVAAVRTLVAADGKMTAFELALTAMLARQLGEASGEGSAKRTAPSKSLADLSDDAALVVSLFIRAASQGSVLFDRFAGELGLKAATLAAPSKVTLAAVEAATTRLADLLPTAKARLVRACMEIVLVDTQVTVREAELMRAVCALLDAPLPPVIELRSRVGAAQDASEPARV